MSFLFNAKKSRISSHWFYFTFLGIIYSIVSVLSNILIFTFIGSLAALIGGLLLLSNKNLTTKVSSFLAPFAAGVLIGAAFFDLIPEAVSESGESGSNVFPWIVVGIIAFFLLERYLHSFHSHEKHHEHNKESKTTVPLIVIGDTVHNFVDGVVIAATFMAEPSLGAVSAVAVFAHELPQEIGDFGLLLHKGLSRMRVITINIVSASFAFLGALITYALGEVLESYIPVLLTLTAGFFIYIALSDLIPEIQYEKKKSIASLQSLVMIAGVLVIWFVVTNFGHAE